MGLEYPNILVAQIYIIFQNDEIFFLLKKKSFSQRLKKSVKENGVFWNILGNSLEDEYKFLVKILDSYGDNLGQDSFLGSV